MKKVVAVILSVMLLASLMVFTVSADDNYNFENMEEELNWVVVGGTEGFTLDDNNVLKLESVNPGGVAAYYTDDYSFGDGTIRFKLKINRNPGWLAVMFRISGGVLPLTNCMELYNDAYDKYALFVNEVGNIAFATWKKGTGALPQFGTYGPEAATTAPFNDGEFHLVEIEVKNASDTSVEMKLYVDGVLYLTALDDGSEAYQGAAITSDGEFAIHAWQGAAFNEGEGASVEIAPAGTAPNASTGDGTFIFAVSFTVLAAAIVSLLRRRVFG